MDRSQRSGRRSNPVSGDGRASHLQGTVIPRLLPRAQLCKLFLNTCAGHCTVSICSICLKHIKNCNTIGYLVTTCMERHMSSPSLNQQLPAIEMKVFQGMSEVHLESSSRKKVQHGAK